MRFKYSKQGNCSSVCNWWFMMSAKCVLLSVNSDQPLNRLRVAIMKILCKFPNLITVGGASAPSIRNLSPQFEAIFTTNSNERSHTLSSHFGI